MKEQMVNRLSATLTHTTPINYRNVPLRRLSTVRNFLGAAVHTKNATLRGTLGIHILFHRKILPVGTLITL